MARVDLPAVTFMIPVRIDSDDRAFNLGAVLRHLCSSLDGARIVVTESGPAPLAAKILAGIDPGGCTLDLLHERTSDPVFHRTRLLNEVLATVRTPVVVNHDADVLLRPEAYEEAAVAILDGGVDLCYPYGVGETQRRVTVPRPYRGEDLFDPRHSSPWQSVCGFVQFVRTRAYIDGGMENEEFLAYGAEDVERMKRFQKLGYRVEWLTHSIWHLEHARGPNSSPANPHFRANEALYYRLAAMPADVLRAYYAAVPYRKKYRA